MVLPIKEAFKAGTLLMPSVPQEAVQSVMEWNGLLVNKILVVLVAFLFAFNLESLFRIIPYVLDCFANGKGYAGLENHPQYERRRNNLAALSVLALCLFCSRYEVINPSFLSLLPDWTGALGVIAVVLLYLLLRQLASALLKPSRRKEETFRIAKHSAWTFAISAALLCMAAVAVMSLLGVSDKAVRNVIVGLICIVYLVLMIRRGQILSIQCNSLTTFLYLCGLEILPTVIFVFAVSKL